jgi:hypothetical protein
MIKRIIIILAYVSSLSINLFAEVLPTGVQWIVKNDGNDDVIYNGGIPDDLSDYTLDGIRHDSLSYRYNYSRRGVLVDVGKVYWFSTEDLYYKNLTDDTSPNFPSDQLFVMWIPGSTEGSDPSQYPENCFSQGYYIPWSYLNGSVDKSANKITLTHLYYDGAWRSLPVGGYYLFRYLHFPITLKSWTGETIGADTEKLVILIHGWNSSGKTYSEDTDFVNLANSVQSKLTSLDSDWKLIAYDWKIDADTGGTTSATPQMAPESKMQTESTDEWPIQNATEAAETAHMHGQYLGQLILQKCPNIKKVQIIAHSAGTWCARTSIKYLIDNTGDNFKAQLTLLDPYMPYQGSADSLLETQIINQLSGYTNSRKIGLLENYYSFDTFILGTNEQFAWGDYGFNACLSRSGSGTVYDGHSGPIYFYRDTATNTVTFDPDWNSYSVIVDHPSMTWNPDYFGWNSSMPAIDTFLKNRCNIDGLSNVNFVDFAILSNHWKVTNCSSSNNWCNGADIDASGDVGINDLILFAENWLK